MALIDSIIRQCTREYVDNVDVNNIPTSKQMVDDFYNLVRTNIIAENALLDKGEKIRYITEMPTSTIAEFIQICRPVIVIARTETADKKMSDLAIYDNNPNSRNYGLYVTDTYAFKEIIRTFQMDISQSKIKEVIETLKEFAPLRMINEDKDLVPVKNGIFNYATKQLMDFSPDYVFDAKIPISYNANAYNVIIQNPDGTSWDIESWLAGLSDDPEVVNLLWMVIGVCVRPYAGFRMAFWLYAERGCNGKGSYLKIIKSLLAGRYSSVSFDSIEDRFALDDLVGKCAILSDESNSSTRTIEGSKRFKALINGEEVVIERKFANSLQYIFNGSMIFCQNTLPKVDDLSSAFLRRIIIIPFDKCFLGDAERTYIKDDYLQRDDVLEYVLHKVLNMNYYKINEPEVCSKLKCGYALDNDFVREFAAEILPKLRGDFACKAMLWELYGAYSMRYNPSGRMSKMSEFWNRFQQIVNDDYYGQWKTHADNYPTRNVKFVNEPLLDEYNLLDWKGTSKNPINLNKIKSSMAAITRVPPTKPFS